MAIIVSTVKRALDCTLITIQILQSYYKVIESKVDFCLANRAFCINSIIIKVHIHCHFISFSLFIYFILSEPNEEEENNKNKKMEEETAKREKRKIEDRRKKERMRKEEKR